MVEVRFVCIPSVEGVKCTFDGVVKYSVAGLCSFFDVAQGEHTYSVEPPEGMRLVSGEDPFGRPLYYSGTTMIEWALIPGTPWPEDQPWLMAFTFEVGEVPPEEVSNILGKVGGILSSIGFVAILFDSARKR